MPDQLPPTVPPAVVQPHLLTNFDKAFAMVLGHEGSWSMDPNDRGNWTTGIIGKGVLKGTKYGISAMSYPELNIGALTPDQAKAIYKRDYWDQIDGDQLPFPIAIMLFDSAVNQGLTYAVQTWQRCLQIKPDGVFGPKTLAATLNVPEVDMTLELSACRAVSYAKSPHFGEDGMGWMRRLMRTLATALQGSH